MTKTLEIIATNLADVKAINQSKADQIELVTDLANGGLSPNLDMIEKSISISQLPIHVMLRPHYRDFIYTPTEFENILSHLKKITSLLQPPQGIVFGSLTSNNQINEHQLQQIIQHKKQLKLVFHRAFDELSDYKSGIQTLNQFPQIHSLLTSGTKPKAIDAIAELKNLVQLSQISIMIGSGVNIDNLKILVDETDAVAFHVGSAVRMEKSVDGAILVERIDELKEVLKG